MLYLICNLVVFKDINANLDGAEEMAQWGRVKT